jgi:hypothetical protein
MYKPAALFMVVLTASVLVASTFGLLTIQRDIPCSGSIKGVGVEVYWNSACSNPTSSIDFGLIEPGDQKSFTLYLKNEGNSDLTLSMTSKDWNPVDAGNYMSLSWDREGVQLSPSQVISCVLTLSVSESIQDISTYGVTVTISGTG